MLQGSLLQSGWRSYIGYDALFGARDTTFFRGGHLRGEGNYMTAEIIEKGDATFTIRYRAENGQEAMMMSMMAMNTKDTSYLSASSDKIAIGTLHVPVLEYLSRKFDPSVATSGAK